ncbi:Ppx/GppA phosphatase family protein [Streptomyces lonarensis]|uniref:Ppx/GppA phosphatase family protein n=1 Tax=Streptomyces lonarensis TaxID=700599 RepID=UPI0028AEDA7A|nr:Ppx/GppA phosphatase family protein [Streptomyces lonarensis]
MDCGTNSIRLLVADVAADGSRLTDLDRRMEIVRLGQGVDRTGRLAPEALERTFAACRQYAEAISALGVDPAAVRFVATSASRDAENRDEFTAGVRELLGVTPEVITGDEEALLSFTGATRGLPADGRGGDSLVVDIGGGSTECVLGADAVRAARSVDIGCVRLTERHLADAAAGGVPAGPPAPERVAAMRADIEAALDLAEERVELRSAQRLVGLAGSVTTVAALALGLEAYDSAAIHRSRVSLEQVREISEMLLTTTHAERAAHAVIHPGRVDVLPAGALVLLAVMERAGVPEVLVSEHDILDGIAYSAAGAVRATG